MAGRKKSPKMIKRTRITKKKSVSKTASSKHKKSPKAEKRTYTKKPAAQKTSFSKEELNKMIEKRAYEIFLEKGSYHGDDWSDWFRAEREIMAKLK